MKAVMLALSLISATTAADRTLHHRHHAGERAGQQVTYTAPNIVQQPLRLLNLPRSVSYPVPLAAHPLTKPLTAVPVFLTHTPLLIHQHFPLTLPVAPQFPQHYEPVFEHQQQYEPVYEPQPTQQQQKKVRHHDFKPAYSIQQQTHYNNKNN